MKIKVMNPKKPKAMKTLKRTTVISFVLIVAGISFLFAIPAKTRLLIGSSFNGISYNVSVHIQGDLPLCNTYLVQVVDARGYSVAPDQVLQPGVSTYVFHERGPAWGVRIARLVESPNLDRMSCNLALYTSPDARTGRFLVGNSYFFNLFPSTAQPSK